MDGENDLEEQLTSYHICKLPTDSQDVPLKLEAPEEPKDYPPAKKKRDSPRNGIPAQTAQASYKDKSCFRLEVFTVESAKQVPQEILGDVPAPEPTRTAEQLPGAYRGQQLMNSGNSLASSSRNSQDNSSTVNVGNSSTKMWYQLPAEEVNESPPVSQLTQLTPTRVSSRSTKGQAPLRLLDLPDKNEAPMRVLQPPPNPMSQIFPPNSRRKQNIITSPPVACIKIEDDDDDVCIVNTQPPTQPPPPPPPQQPPAPKVQPIIEARHVIKLVTSVPVAKYPCEFCGAKFELWNQRDSHMGNVHRIGGVFVCFVCQKAAREFYIREEAIFQTPHYHLLQAHLAESHKITGQPRGFQCPYCVIHPANYEALVKHLTADHDTAALMFMT
uniref:Uncharacterized protein n=1 Tax=Phlebotomus papatasi TaxID=29031 RepID=A0A1B0DB58_PHLPP